MEKLKYQGLKRTIPQWAKQFGIPEATIRRKLKQGCSLEEALARKPQGEKTLNFRGKIQSISAWAKELELTPKAIEQRLAKGLPIAMVLRPKHPPVPVSKAKQISFQGRTMSMQEWGREMGVDRRTIRRHLARGTTDLLPFVPRKRKLITYKGRTMTANKWAKEIGLTAQAVYVRIARGLPIEEVLSPKKRVGRGGGRKRRA